jgi:flagellar FliL protein
MPKEPLPPEQKPETPAAVPAPDANPFPMKKVFIFGVPIFLVQVVVIYFLVTKFVYAQPDTQTPGAQQAEHTPDAAADTARELFVVNDLIVNPAGTNGTRFLLTTVGVEVASAQAKAELAGKEIQVRDALISILTSKSLDQLGRMEQREVLRKEIAQRVGEMLTSGKPQNVYFGKFIIQ